LTVGHDAGQRGYFCQPPAVVFSLNLNRECHEVNVPSGLAANKAMDPTPRGPLSRPARRRSSPVRWAGDLGTNGSRPYNLLDFSWRSLRFLKLNGRPRGCTPTPRHPEGAEMK
jgi:hypothetical protein